MIISDWLPQAEALVASDTPRLDAELLLAHYLGKNRAYLLAFDEKSIDDALLDTLNAAVKKMAKGYPLPYLLGTKAFWDMDLKVTEGTLIPRADTETLIELAQQLFPAGEEIALIDLGTGSGAIAIALSRVFINADIIATDVSAQALQIARVNAKNWQGSTIHFMENDWLSGFDEKRFDLIVSNPPYIDGNDPHLAKLGYEPIDALVAADKGLGAIRTIIQQSQSVLKPAGYLLLEHGYCQGDAVRQLLDNPCWQRLKTYRDLGGNERVTAAQRTKEEAR